jgi:hypothetical protein
MPAQSVAQNGHQLDVRLHQVPVLRPQQAVAEQAQPRRRRRRRGPRDDAGEARRCDVARELAGQEVADRCVVKRRARRAARLVQIARHGEGAGHPARDARVLVRREVLDLGHRVLRSGALDGQVGKVVVAELGERVVADVQHPPAQRLLARDGEVPCRVQAAAGGRDLGLAQRAAQARGDFGTARRADRTAVGAAKVAQHRDVAPPLGEVLSRMDLDQPLRGARGVRVQLGPHRPALAGLGVDDEHRGVGARVARDVAQADRIRALQRRWRVEARDTGEDHRTGTEAVKRAVGRGIDRLAGLVARHLRAGEVQPHTGRGRGLSRVGVAWKRQELWCLGDRGRGDDRRDDDQQAGEPTLANPDPWPRCPCSRAVAHCAIQGDPMLPPRIRFSICRRYVPTVGPDGTGPWVCSPRPSEVRRGQRRVRGSEGSLACRARRPPRSRRARADHPGLERCHARGSAPSQQPRGRSSGTRGFAIEAVIRTHSVLLPDQPTSAAGEIRAALRAPAFAIQLLFSCPTHLSA